MACPSCGGIMQGVNIVKYNNRKIYGRNIFCLSSKCDVEFDVSRGKREVKRDEKRYR